MPTIELESVFDQDMSIEHSCEGIDHEKYIHGHSDANDILWLCNIFCGCNRGIEVQCDGWIQDTLKFRERTAKTGRHPDKDYFCKSCEEWTKVDIMERIQ